MAYEFTRLQDEEIVSSISSNAHVFVEDGNGVKRVSKDLIGGGGSSTPAITIEESQVTSITPLIVQFTAEQAAIIENDSNNTVRIDATALGMESVVFNNIKSYDESHHYLTVIAFCDCSSSGAVGLDGNYIVYDTVNKRGMYSDYRVCPTTKTDAMTQAVGVDDSGQLWTTPGGGGMPDPSEMEDGTALVAVNGEWVEQTGYGYKEVTNVTWDGNTEGKTSVVVSDILTFYQISSSTASAESFIGNKLTSKSGDITDESIITIDDINDMGSLVIIGEDTPQAVIALQDNATIEDVTFPNLGIYFLKLDDGTYISSLEVADFTKFSLGYIPLPGIYDGSSEGSIRTSGSKSEAFYNIGICAFAEGYETLASGHHSHAEGHKTIARKTASHAEGYYTIAGGYDAHAEGHCTCAIGGGSHAEGDGSYCADWYAHTEGMTDVLNVITTDLGEVTEIPFEYNPMQEGLVALLLPLAVGQKVIIKAYIGDDISYYIYERTITNISLSSDTTVTPHKITVDSSINFTDFDYGDIYILGALGVASHSEGFDNTAAGYGGHVEGAYNSSVGIVQHVQGMYAVEDTIIDPEASLPVSHYLDIVGNGNFATGTRSNASALDWSGNLHLNGNVYVGCNADSTGGVPVTSVVSVPASGSATGTVGQMAVDSSYLYVCVAENTWKKVALTNL